MKNNDIHKSFTLAPFNATDKNGEVIDLDRVMENLKNDVTMLSDLADWFIDFQLLEDFNNLDDKTRGMKSSYISRILDIKVPNQVLDNFKSGKSRYSEMMGSLTIDTIKSWSRRVKASNQSPEVYISQGWKRTANPSIPDIMNPKMCLSSVDHQYSRIVNDPLNDQDDYIILEIVVNGKWVRLYFDFDHQRFKGAYKITKPDITLDENGSPLFHFTCVYEYVYTHFNPDYVIAVDVGITNYVTASIIRISDRSIVEGTSTTLSPDVHSLVNKVRKTNTQIASLHKKGRGGEVIPHRKANSRRKRELAILAGRELSTLSAQWGNAIIVFEDLSWISNTIQNGRWNRGELVKWTQHFVELNGGRIAKVNSAYTSQECHKCHESLLIVNHHHVYCSSCNTWQDRDVNATANIGQEFINASLDKYVKTRIQAKKSTNKQVVRVKQKPVTRRVAPKSDRSKNKPTPKRLKRTFTSNGLEVTCKRIGSPEKTVTGGVREKRVPRIMTVRSNQKRRLRVKSEHLLQGIKH